MRHPLYCFIALTIPSVTQPLLKVSVFNEGVSDFLLYFLPPYLSTAFLFIQDKQYSTIQTHYFTYPQFHYSDVSGMHTCWVLRFLSTCLLFSRFIKLSFNYAGSLLYFNWRAEQSTVELLCEVYCLLESSLKGYIHCHSTSIPVSLILKPHWRLPIVNYNDDANAAHFQFLFWS